MFFFFIVAESKGDLDAINALREVNPVIIVVPIVGAILIATALILLWFHK